jgi:uroporphyrinogen decarboxylase
LEKKDFMDHRERVLTAVNHAEPDRVPLAMWGSAYGITDPLYFKLLDLLHLGGPVPPFRPRRGHTISYYDDRVLEALDVDVRHVDIGFTDLAGPSEHGGMDAWGIDFDKSGIYLSAATHPLATASLADLDRYAWPDVERFLRRGELVDRARYLKQNTDYAVVGRAVDSYGAFERCCALRGTEAFMLDLASDEAFAAALIDRVTGVLYRLLEIYLADAGPYLDILELPGDDYAALRPIISPRMFDRFFAPVWKRLIDLVRQAAPGCKILFHSDGNMEPFLSRLIDLGVDIFHCLEPLDTVDMPKIKQAYGSRLTFWGAVDIKRAMTGSPAAVTAEVRQRIRDLAPGGGYVIAPANHLQPDVPPENVVTLVRAAHEYGRYPIGK